MVPTTRRAGNNPSRSQWRFPGLLILLFLVAAFETPSAGGLGWSTPTQLPTTTFINYAPSATLDTQGTLWVFWQGVKTSPFLQEDIYYKTFNQSTWSSDQRLTYDPPQDTTPSALGLRNGTMFVVWASNRTSYYDLYSMTITNGFRSAERQLTNGPSHNWRAAVAQGLDGSIWVFWNKLVGNNYDIYYRVYNGLSWSSERTLTQDPAADVSPTAMVTKDGKIWVAWGSYRTGDYEIFAKVYDGSAWSPDRQITFHPTDDDVDPALVQDRNGTLWLFWSRTLQAPAPKYFQNDIYYKTSQDNGVSWSSIDTPLTSTPNFDENNVAAVQGNDRRLWIFYSSNLPAGSTFNLFYSTSDPILTHDVAVKAIKVTPEKVRYNTSAVIEATLANLGDFPETTMLKLYLNSTLIFSQSTSLAVGETKTIPFSYNTLNTKPARYTLRGDLAPVPGETLGNQGDNSLSGARLHALPPGDVDQDGNVDILDAGTVILAFNSAPGSPNWNSNADIDFNGRVDIVDVSITLFWFDTVT